MQFADAMLFSGSGITPMYQMISHSLKLPEDKTKWTLIFANVTEKDIRRSSRFEYTPLERFTEMQALIFTFSSTRRVGQARQAAP
jgi:ferredoxin-NADP reductase